jgi:ABC-type multidrug transport system permease subunit
VVVVEIIIATVAEVVVAAVVVAIIATVMAIVTMVRNKGRSKPRGRKGSKRKSQIMMTSQPSLKKIQMNESIVSRSRLGGVNSNWSIRDFFFMSKMGIF